jgi:hypothetical protein
MAQKLDARQTLEFRGLLISKMVHPRSLDECPRKGRELTLKRSYTKK